MPAAVTDEWYWEGNVALALVQCLQAEGWQVVSMADTFAKQRGVDIHCAREEQTLLIEVKGYPSQRYRDPRRAGEIKPTSPTLQAGHWYSHALLAAMRLQTRHPEARIALGLPDFPRYRRLIEETRMALKRLDIEILLMSEDGSMMRIGKN